MRIVGKIAIITGIIGFLVIIFFSVKSNIFKADEAAIQTQTEEITLSKGLMKLNILTTNGQTQAKVNVTENSKTSNTLVLDATGFTNCTDLFGLKEAALDLVCLVADVGVHSQKMYLMSYSQGVLSFARNTKDTEISDFFLSDEPNFQFEKTENQTNLYVDSRNYDLDPTRDAIRSVFRFTEGGFAFDKETNFQYD